MLLLFLSFSFSTSTRLLFPSSFLSFTLSFNSHFLIHILGFWSNSACTISQRATLCRIDHLGPGCVAISRAQSQCEEHWVPLQNDALTMRRRISMTLTMTSKDDTITSNQNLEGKKNSRWKILHVFNAPSIHCCNGSNIPLNLQ